MYTRTYIEGFHAFACPFSLTLGCVTFVHTSDEASSNTNRYLEKSLVGPKQIFLHIMQVWGDELVDDKLMVASSTLGGNTNLAWNINRIINI